MANTSTIIGYVVKTQTGEYIAEPDERGYNYVTRSRPAPVGKSDAYRRLAAFLDENDGWEEDLYVTPVFYEPTPLEKASKELGGLLESLCSRHGLDLGLTREQMEKQIAKELEELKAGGSSFVATGIPQFR